jgi:hypothetical protein
MMARLRRIEFHFYFIFLNILCSSSEGRDDICSPSLPECTAKCPDVLELKADFYSGSLTSSTKKIIESELQSRTCGGEQEDLYCCAKVKDPVEFQCQGKDIKQ